MMKSISFIVLTYFFHFNELNFKATRLLIFQVKPIFKTIVKIIIFFTVYWNIQICVGAASDKTVKFR